MPESCAKPLDETAVKSPLDKPLQQLTEDDIAQVTREDCRRYLKKKGMRRPSWNKSQAIQQVIMLKTLLETTPDSDAGSRKRLLVSRPNNNIRSSIIAILDSAPKRTTGDEENSLSAEETTPHCRKDLDNLDSTGGVSGRFAAANDESAQPRNPGSTNMPIGQMTIFYCGKVNVYDDVTADKARALMHIAASPQQLPDEQQVDGAAVQRHLPYLSKAVSSRAHQDSAVVILPTPQTVKMNDSSLVPGEENKMLREETHVEGPSTRKASVQRYLEKRKERFKSKVKPGMTACASLDVYFNLQMGNQIPRIDTCSIPHQIRQHPTSTRCSSVENDSVKKVCLSTGLSNKGV